MNALIHGVLSILFKKWPKDVYNDMRSGGQYQCATTIRRENGLSLPQKASPVDSASTGLLFSIPYHCSGELSQGNAVTRHF
ncbi:hypothetical protein ACWWJF_13045 [Symbiopectobacterium sp. Eva_TO]